MTRLTCEVHVPGDAADGVPVVVLLHGRGADRHDLFGLRGRMPSGWAVVAPDAPHEGGPWGYGPGRAWYRYLGRNRPEPTSFRSSLDALADLLGELRAVLGVEPGPIALGGFSQGGTVSLGYGLTRRAPHVDRIFNLSGFLADHPEVAATPASVEGLRLFWGHGTADPSIPFELALEGRALLQDAGADLTVRDYAMGHGIEARELADLTGWLTAV